MEHVKKSNILVNIIDGADVMLAEVVLTHTEDSDRFYKIAVSTPEVEDWMEFTNAVRYNIEQKYDPAGYYQEIFITLIWVVDDKVYRQSI